MHKKVCHKAKTIKISRDATHHENKRNQLEKKLMRIVLDKTIKTL